MGASIREHRSRLRLILSRQSAAPTPPVGKSSALREPKSGPESTSDTWDELSDEQLLAQHHRGNRAAFAVLYRRHASRARALALNVTRDENDANEVVQEAFIRVLRNWSRFHGHAAFYTWLYRITYNLSIDQIRRVGRYRHAFDPIEPLAEIAPELPLGSGATPNPFDACVTRELRAVIAAAIESLPHYQRNVIVMRELYGMSYAEIANKMACSKGTVMSRLFHARNRLQVLLELCNDATGRDPGQDQGRTPKSNLVSSRLRSYGQR